MLRKMLFVFIIVALVATVAFTSMGKELWKPTKPITVIVPWGAGGSTDQITRILAGELEGKLGQKIVIVNQSGGSGSVVNPVDLVQWVVKQLWMLKRMAILGLLE
jgi:tripartite-type tricarboxylate transporter receptor subunit TctC